MIRNILFAGLILVLTSCSEPINNDAKVQRLFREMDSLQMVITHLQDDTLRLNHSLSEADGKLKEVYRNSPSLRESMRQALVSYAYVVLDYTLVSYNPHGDIVSSKPMQAISPIETVGLWNEDDKYRLMDRYQAEIEKAYSAGAKVHVIKRDALHFDNYATASKSLESIK